MWKKCYLCNDRWATDVLIGKPDEGMCYWCYRYGPEIQERVKLFNGLCAYCGARATHIDHIIPISSLEKIYSLTVYDDDYWMITIGDLDNLVPACRRCNSSKCARPLIGWYTRRPWYSAERLRFILDHMPADLIELGMIVDLQTK